MAMSANRDGERSRVNATQGSRNGGRPHPGPPCPLGLPARRPVTRAQKGRTPDLKLLGLVRATFPHAGRVPFDRAYRTRRTQVSKVVRRDRRKLLGTAGCLAAPWAAYRTTWIVAAGQPLVCQYQMPGSLGDPYERGGAVKLLSVVLPSGSEDPLYDADARDKRQYGSGLPGTATPYSTCIGCAYD